MTPQELKNSILQMAIQGTLVEQRPEEGTAWELYQQIQAEKQKLIKAGTIKKDKPLPEISEDEKPFDIPESWQWVRLRTIVYNRGQEVPSALFSYIDIGSIDNKNQRLNAEENLIEADKAPSRARKIVELGDILYSTVRPYLHNMCIIDRQFSCKPIASTGFAAMTCYEGIYNKYLFFHLLSPAFDSYANHTENSKGVAYPAINDDRLYRALVPLPPLAEQKRIVAKIEELLPYIDRYEQAWSKLEEFNKCFPTAMQKSILQTAIQGKLVEQRPEEGTAEDLYRQMKAEKQRLIKAGTIKKDKPLPEITEDEKPFDIPEGWKWVRLDDIVQKNIKRGKSPKYIAFSNTLVFAQKCNVKTGGINMALAQFLDETTLQKYPNEEFMRHMDIIVNSTGNGTMGRIGVFRSSDNPENKQIVPDSHVTVVRVSKYMLPEYTYCFLRSRQPYLESMGDGSTNQTELKPNVIRSLVIPLPPLAEQKRIVAKIEELLPLCDKIKSNVEKGGKRC